MMHRTPVPVTAKIQSAEELISELCDAGFPWLTRTGDQSQTSDATIVERLFVPSVYLMQLGGLIAATIAIGDGRPYRPAQQRAIRRRLGQWFGPGEATERVIEAIVATTTAQIWRYRSAIEFLAEVRLQTPRLSDDALRRHLQEAMARTTKAESQVVVTWALGLRAAGQLVTHVQVPQAWDDVTATFGRVTLSQLSTPAQFVLNHRADLVRSSAFGTAHVELLDEATRTTAAYRRGEADAAALFHARQRLEHAIDQVIGPIPANLHPALDSTAEWAALIAGAVEEVAARTTGIAVPIWPARIEAIAAFARLPLSSTSTLARFDVIHHIAADFVDQHTGCIGAVTTELLRTSSMDGATFEQLVSHPAPVLRITG